MAYAEGTSVPAERSRLEIERIIITNYKGTNFGYAQDENAAMIYFRMNNRQIKFVLPLPEREDFKFRPGPRHVIRPEGELQEILAQATRQRWRALVLAIKAKLETVASGISSFETEFMAYTILPGGKTAAEHYLPEIQLALESKRPPVMRLTQGKE